MTADSDRVSRHGYEPCCVSCVDLTEPSEVRAAAQHRYLNDAKFHAEVYRAVACAVAEWTGQVIIGAGERAAMKSAVAVALYLRDAEAGQDAPECAPNGGHRFSCREGYAPCQAAPKGTSTAPDGAS